MPYRRSTLSKFIIEEQRKLSGGSELIALVNDIQTACKYIAVAVAKGPLAGTRGSTGNINVQGEEQKPLDMISNDIMLKCCEWGGYLAGMASEEMDEPYAIPDIYPRGRYLLVFDPLDGSSNADVNVSVGTIFSILRHDRKEAPKVEDFLQKGIEQVAAGYAIYGPSTMLVITVGKGTERMNMVYFKNLTMSKAPIIPAAMPVFEFEKDTEYMKLLFGSVTEYPVQLIPPLVVRM